MFLTELFSPAVDEDVSNTYVNAAIKKDRKWKHLGGGYTASVWQHLDDPSTVVKVLGGGDANWEAELYGEGGPRVGRAHRAQAIAFVHFCVDQGHRSKHLPIIHGINIDDNAVVQIKVERLKELPHKRLKGYMGLHKELSGLADSIKWASGGRAALKTYVEDFDNALEAYGLSHNNKAVDIINTIYLLVKAAPVYAKAHGLDYIRVDLHSENWLMRADGTIVAADPWYSDRMKNN
jgi:hypothetical protein